MRTRVRLKPYEFGWVRVADEFKEEIFPVDRMPLDVHLAHFALILAILSHFGVHGVNVELSYESPPKSGLA